MGFTGRTPSVGYILIFIIILILMLVFASGCFEQKEKKYPVRVVAAGSLLLPLEEIEKRFEQKYPQCDILIEGHGSIQAIRQVTDLSRSFDVVLVADESLIPLLMYQTMPGTGKNWTDMDIPFGRTEMVLAFTNQSRYAGEINRQNWYEILKKPDVRIGVANPVLDAAGYRSIMVLALADRYYGSTNILDQVFTGHFTPEIPVERKENSTWVILPDVMKPSGQKVSIRDGSIFLLSLLKTGGVDYAFEYRCVAEGADLPYIRLNDELNLGNPEFSDFYKTAVVDLNFQRFSSVNLTRIGSPLVYAACIPANAAHPQEAAAFINELTGENSNITGMPDPL
ncbi:tungstate ABC transporter substrate-binding protein WtpA [Methanospirillum lacunae]|uniref:Tungstate ABC transporter substrate-binding protein WtpA n=1 Tax=Methanospirillum lacunae TaxID=668570 RepID=A0A2V2NDH1_9EURY|nr:tungstate ABC transporter substrate-binding protein WtpA [Methanospirillum lacunae]PWR74468.1 tungstate ABC transporter substrate-binding protein WtpA [Methanospirillum lacunae]